MPQNCSYFRFSSAFVWKKTSILLGFSRLFVGEFLCYAPCINVLRGERILKLLIAVRSEIIADSLTSCLSQYEIHICNTGTDALTILETLQPEMLILDMTLPAIDGLTVLQKTCFRPHIILALTNLVSPAVLQAAAAAGVQDMILIPCTVRHIIERLDALIEKAPSAES